MARMAVGTEFHPKRSVRSTYGWLDVADASPLRVVPGSYPRRKELQ
jgi:hypothetical protein